MMTTHLVSDSRSRRRTALDAHHNNAVGRWFETGRQRIPLIPLTLRGAQSYVNDYKGSWRAGTDADRGTRRRMYFTRSVRPPLTDNAWLRFCWSSHSSAVLPSRRTHTCPKSTSREALRDDRTSRVRSISRCSSLTWVLRRINGSDPFIENVPIDALTCEGLFCD